MDRSLLLAILSMDSYNRGYGISTKLPIANVRIGKATVLADSEQFLNGSGQNVGFYATSYDLTGSGIDGLTGRVIVYPAADRWVCSI